MVLLLVEGIHAPFTFPSIPGQYGHLFCRHLAVSFEAVNEVEMDVLTPGPPSLSLSVFFLLFFIFLFVFLFLFLFVFFLFSGFGCFSFFVFLFIFMYVGCLLSEHFKRHVGFLGYIHLEIKM